ncbi:MAG: ATP-binding protein, partial [Solirubrobacterales bacterium]
LERDGHVDAKGMENPLSAFRAVAICDEDELSQVPLVGREDDLEMLRLIARRAARERVPQLVTVIGEAGVGKTRISGELFDELRSQGWRTVVGRSPPTATASPSGPSGRSCTTPPGPRPTPAPTRSSRRCAVCSRRSAPMTPPSSRPPWWWRCEGPTRAPTPRTS